MRVMGVKFNPLEQISLKVILRKGVDVWMDKEMDSRYIVYLQDMGFFWGGGIGATAHREILLHITFESKCKTLYGSSHLSVAIANSSSQRAHFSKI